MGDVVDVVGARAGHGATSVAVMISCILRSYGIRSHVTTKDPETLAALTSPTTAQQRGAVSVRDSGSVPERDRPNGGSWIVVRGPDILGTIAAARNAELADGLILVREPWRALTSTDLQAATHLPVSAVVPHSPAIARTLDSGTFGVLDAGHPDLEDLRGFVGRLWARWNHSRLRAIQ